MEILSNGYYATRLGIMISGILGSVNPLGRLANSNQLRLLDVYHRESVHKLRELALWIPKDGQIADLAECEKLHTEEYCDAASKTMAEALNSKIAPHCSLKVCISHEDGFKIATIGRSKQSDRASEYGLGLTHEAGKNTVFASMLGIKDRYQNWKRPFPTFVCNDLTKVTNEFCCDRKEWDKYYKSTLAYPIRFKQSGDEEYSIIGFLTFDKSTPNGFPGFPCNFDYVDQTEEFAAACSKMASWHIGACMADSLAILLFPLARKSEKQLPLNYP